MTYGEQKKKNHYVFAAGSGGVSQFFIKLKYTEGGQVEVKCKNLNRPINGELENHAYCG